MRETPEDKDANSEGLPPSGNAAVSEAVWQKWLNKNKERDAVRRKKLIRLLWSSVATEALVHPRIGFRRHGWPVANREQVESSNTKRRTRGGIAMENRNSND